MAQRSKKKMDEDDTFSDGASLDDFVIDNLLEEEILEFQKLMRLQKIYDIMRQEPTYYI